MKHHHYWPPQKEDRLLFVCVCKVPVSFAYSNLPFYLVRGCVILKLGGSAQKLNVNKHKWVSVVNGEKRIPITVVSGTPMSREDSRKLLLGVAAEDDFEDDDGSGSGTGRFAKDPELGISSGNDRIFHAKSDPVAASRQTWSALGYCLGALSMGTMLGWASPALPQLETASIIADKGQSGWVGAVMCLGALIQGITQDTGKRYIM